MKRNLVVLILLALLFLPAAASAVGYDRIIGAGEVVNEDINVFDNDLLIEEDAVVNGKVTVFDGHVDVYGTINGGLTVFDGDVTVDGAVIGDLVIFAGDIRLTSNATVDGSCFSLGGNVVDENRSTACTAYGSRLREVVPAPFATPVMPEMPEMPAMPEMPEMPEMPVMPAVPSFETPRVVVSPESRARQFAGDVSEAVGRSLLLGIFALVVAAIFPRHLEQVGQAVRERPAASGAVGFLTAIAVPSLVFLLALVLLITCVGILLYPALGLLTLVPVAALLMGWVAVGERFGSALLRSFKRTGRSLITTAALGTALLTLGLGLLALVPPFSFGGGFGVWLVGVILAFVGLGAAVLTRFGTRPYPPGSAPRGKVETVLETLPEGDEPL